MADTLQSLGLLKPDFTTLPPDSQDNPWALADAQAYADALRRQDALPGGGDPPPIGLSAGLAQALKAYVADAPSRQPANGNSARPMTGGPGTIQQRPLAVHANTDGAVPVASGSGIPDGQDDRGAPLPQKSWWDTVRDDGKLALGVGRNIATSLSPELDSIINHRNYLDAVRDHEAGLASGVAQVPASLLHLGGYASGWAGGRKLADTLHRWGDNTGGYFDQYAADPNSSSFRYNKIYGELLGTAPVVELTPFTVAARAGEAGKIVSALARYGDMAVQGATAGALASGGKDMASAAANGAVLAPALGAAGDVLIPVAGRVGGAAGDRLKALAHGFRGGGAEGPVAGDAAGPIPGGGPAPSPPPAPSPSAPPPAADVAYAEFLGGLQSRFDNNASLDDLYRYAHDHGVKPDEIPDLPDAIRNRDAHKIPARFVPLRQLDIPVADAAWGQAGAEMTPVSYADDIIAGRGEGDSPLALALRQYLARNGPAIEAEFSRRADEATRAGLRGMTPIAPLRMASSVDDARAAASQFLGQPLTHPVENVTATLTRASLKKATHGKAVAASDSASNHSLAVANADNLFRNSELLYRYPDPRGEPTLAISRWRSYIDTPDGVRGAKITVKETAYPRDPNPLYTIQTMPVEPVVKVPRWTGGLEPGLLPTDASVGVEGKPARGRLFLGRSSEFSLTPTEVSDKDVARLAGVMRNAAAAGGGQGGVGNGGGPPAGSAAPGANSQAGGTNSASKTAAERARALRMAEGLRRHATRRAAPILATAWQRQKQQQQSQQQRRSN